jgi:hypothetical protein
MGGECSTPGEQEILTELRFEIPRGDVLVDERIILKQEKV